MTKKQLQRYLPDTDKIRQHKYLRMFGSRLQNPLLWHINRRSFARAAAIGLFACFMPMPFQMVLAAALAILFQANLPLSVALVWISNPLTIPPLFYFAYKVGTWVLQLPPKQFQFELSMQWLQQYVMPIWQPLLVGSFICAIVSATIAFVSVRLIWRWHIVRRWQARGR